MLEEMDLDETNPVIIKYARQTCLGCGGKPRDPHNMTACMMFREAVNVLIENGIFHREQEITTPVKTYKEVSWPIHIIKYNTKSVFNPFRGFEVSFLKETVSIATVNNARQFKLLMNSIVSILRATPERWSLYPEVGGLMGKVTSKYLNPNDVKDQNMMQLSQCLKQYILDEVVNQAGTDQDSMVPANRHFKRINAVKKFVRNNREDGLPGIIKIDGTFLPSHRLENWTVNSAQEHFQGSDRTIQFFRVNPDNAFTVENDEMNLKDWPTCKKENSTGRSGVLNLSFTLDDSDRPHSLLGDFHRIIEDTLGEEFQIDQTHLLLKEANYCTGPHQDIHDYPHITVYQQLYGKSMFLSMPRSLNTYFEHVVCKKTDSSLFWKNARATMQNSSDERLVHQYTLNAGETLIVTPCSGHTVFVPANSRFSIVRAVEVLPKRLHKSLEMRGVNLERINIRPQNEEAETSSDSQVVEKKKRKRRKRSKGKTGQVRSENVGKTKVVQATADRRSKRSKKTGGQIRLKILGETKVVQSTPERRSKRIKERENKQTQRTTHTGLPLI